MNGDIARSEPDLPEPPSLPRKVTMTREAEGYGFNLHGEKGIHGQFISAIDEGSPAEKNDLRVGDRVIAVNNEDVENLPHAKVVERIRAGGNSVILLVVDEQCDQFYKSRNAKIPQDRFETTGESLPSPEAEENHVNINVEEVETPAEINEKENEVAVPVSVHEAPEAPEEASKERENTAEEDEYEEVIPKTATELEPDQTAVETPAETLAETAVETAPETTPTPEEVSSTTTTTNETSAPSANGPVSDTINTSSKLDMAAARPKPKRHEVKRATQNWKQKYDDFNKL